MNQGALPFRSPYGGIFNDSFIAYLLLSLMLKEFWEHWSCDIAIDKEFSGTFWRKVSICSYFCSTLSFDTSRSWDILQADHIMPYLWSRNFGWCLNGSQYCRRSHCSKWRTFLLPYKTCYELANWVDSGVSVHSGICSKICQWNRMMCFRSHSQ